jgi:hypothetical protein
MRKRTLARHTLEGDIGLVLVVVNHAKLRGGMGVKTNRLRLVPLELQP